MRLRRSAIVRGRVVAIAGVDVGAIELVPVGSGVAAADQTATAAGRGSVAAIARGSASRGWTDGDGAFELPAAVGDHELVVRGGDDLVVGRVPVPALTSGEKRDLGDLQLRAPGRLVVAISLPGGARPADVVLVVVDAHGDAVRVPWLFESRSWPEGVFAYRLECSNALWCRGESTVRAGATTTLAHTLTPAVMQRLVARVPTAAALSIELDAPH